MDPVLQQMVEGMTIAGAIIMVVTYRVRWLRRRWFQAGLVLLAAGSSFWLVFAGLAPFMD